MPEPREGLPAQPQTVIMSNPARTITVHDAGTATERVDLKSGALRGTEADLAKEIVSIATFGRDKSRALEADLLVADTLERGGDDTERACRTYLHKELGVPTHDQVTEAYAAHYQSPTS